MPAPPPGGAAKGPPAARARVSITLPTDASKAPPAFRRSSPPLSRTSLGPAEKKLPAPQAPPGSGRGPSGRSHSAGLAPAAAKAALTPLPPPPPVVGAVRRSASRGLAIARDTSPGRPGRRSTSADPPAGRRALAPPPSYQGSFRSRSHGLIAAPLSKVGRTPPSAKPSTPKRTKPPNAPGFNTSQKKRTRSPGLSVDSNTSARERLAALASLAAAEPPPLPPHHPAPRGDSATPPSAHRSPHAKNHSHSLTMTPGRAPAGQPSKAPRRGTSPQLTHDRSSPAFPLRAPSPGPAAAANHFASDAVEAVSPTQGKRLVSPHRTVEAMGPPPRRAQSPELRLTITGPDDLEASTASVDLETAWSVEVTVDDLRAAVSSPRDTAPAHVLRPSGLLQWVEQIQCRTFDEDPMQRSCLIFLCGAPGAGKTWMAQRLLSHYPELVHIFSIDMHPDTYFLRDRAVVFRPCDNPEGRFDFPWFKAHVLRWIRDRYHAQLAARRPSILVFDDTNAVLHDCLEAVSLARQAGIPAKNIAWFVFDQGLPEDDEVAFLAARQQQRQETFWARVDRGEHPSPADGKDVPVEKIRSYLRRLRYTFFKDGQLVSFDDDFIDRQVAAYQAQEEARRQAREARRPAERHVYSAAQLPAWLDRTMARATTSCVVFLCGAPGSGKSTLAAQLAERYRPRLKVFSVDRFPGLYFLQDGHVAFRPTANPLGKFDAAWYRQHVLHGVLEQFEAALASPEPQILLFDDTNTIFKECTEKIVVALRAGVPVQRIVWCVLDMGLPEEAEVAALAARQRQRGAQFQQRLLAGDPLPPCEGKVIAADKLLKFVQRLRSSYVAGDGSLRALSDDWIVAQAQAYTNGLDSKPAPVKPPAVPAAGGAGSPPGSPCMRLQMVRPISPESRSPPTADSAVPDSRDSRTPGKGTPATSSPRRPPTTPSTPDTDRTGPRSPRPSVPRVAHVAAPRGPSARERVNAERQARLAQFVGMTVRHPASAVPPATMPRVAAAILGRRGTFPVLQLAGQPEVLVVDIDALLTVPGPYQRRWDSRSHGMLTTPLAEGGLGWFQGVTVARVAVEKGCYARAEPDRLPRQKQTPVVVICPWEVVLASPGGLSDFQRQVFKTLRLLGWPVDHVLTQDMAGTGRDLGPQAFVHWCLEQVRSLSNGAAIHLVQTQASAVDGLPAELIRRVSIWPPATVTYELPDEVEEAVVQGLIHRRGRWLEMGAAGHLERWGIESQASYAAVGLPDKSRSQLLRTMKPFIPEGWHLIAHHMTICGGDLEAAKAKERAERPPGTKLARVAVGQPVLLLAEAFGRNAQAAAVRVSGFVTTSKVPHITLAVCEGGKPGASNHIEDWQPVPVQRLLGVVRQYKAYSLWRELTG